MSIIFFFSSPLGTRNDNPNDWLLDTPKVWLSNYVSHGGNENAHFLIASYDEFAFWERTLTDAEVDRISVLNGVLLP